MLADRALSLGICQPQPRGCYRFGYRGGLVNKQSRISLLFALSGLPHNAMGAEMNELTRTVRSALLVAAALALPSGAARADTIVQPLSFSASSSSAATLVLFDLNLSIFNPANGTLNDVKLNASGSATWTATGSPPSLEFDLDGQQGFILKNTFSTPGAISFNYSGTSSASAVLTYWQTGDPGLGGIVGLLAGPPNLLADTITNLSVTGTITFDFTPTAAVPEPSTWAMMLLGFAGLGFAFRRSRRMAAFA